MSDRDTSGAERLQEAVDTIRQVIEQGGEPLQYDYDMKLLALAYLADHPEDDDGPVRVEAGIEAIRKSEEDGPGILWDSDIVTAELLLGRGWRRSGVGQVLMMVDGQPKEVERAVYYDTEEPGDLERLFVRDHEGDTAYVPCGPTVGDLRAACRVLHIGGLT